MKLVDTTHMGEFIVGILQHPERLAAAACLIVGGCVLEAVDNIEDGIEGTNNSGTSDGEGNSNGGGAGGDDGDGNGSGNGGGGTVDGCAEIETQALEVLEAHCEVCHNADSNAAGFGFVTDLEKLVLSGTVIAGDPTNSPLYARMAGGSMPPLTAPSQPTGDDITIISDWIGGCLDESPAACDNQEWISHSKMVDIMLADIATISPADRVFTRYLTLTHLHNIGYCEDKLDRFRFGLSKGLNSLSQDPLITRPTPIDEWSTIYRIDLRDYDWELAQGVDKWELLIANNPYAVRFIDDDAEVLQDFTDTEVPFMSADWFVHDGSEPPLYYDMAEIPSSLDQLANQLGIDLQENVDNREVVRSGFLSSGVSQSNRVFERHQLPNSAGSAFWLSFDFESNEGDQNIFANPLDFDPNGGEAIFSLPNGLQAYVIADAAGVRLDEAPINIVTDPLQEDKVVRAGISCMSCHDSGLKLKPDEIRNYVESSLDFNENTKELVEELHPREEEMSQYINDGSQVFNSAVAALWDGPAGNLEPMIDVYNNFDSNVDLKRAAAEFGVRPDALLSQLGELDPTYAPLNGGVISRETFEAKFAESICVLNLGITNDPACSIDDN